METAYLCRTCGAKCPSLAGWEDRGQLCVRCANPTRRKPPVQSIFLNGVEVVGAENIAAAIRERAMADFAADTVRLGKAGREALLAEAERLGVVIEPDPFRDAIDRAAADWADDNPDL